MHISKLDLLTSRFLFSTKVWRIYCLIKREFDIRTLRNKPAFVNDVDIHRRLLRQKVVRNNPCNQV